MAFVERPIYIRVSSRLVSPLRDICAIIVKLGTSLYKVSRMKKIR
jgi:hypothetical protein